MKQLHYISTRNKNNKVLAHQAIIKGIAEDGGLFVPEHIPQIDKSFDELSELSYQELAKYILSLYLTDFTEEEIADCVDSAYDEKFDDDRIAPLVQVGDAQILELFHGKTIAFKDMALSILPHFMRHAKAKLEMKEKVVILTATSGDTGKAALEGFKDVDGFEIIVFYPKNGVSEIQERQMVTTTGDNTKVVGVVGNFDDTQTGVKELFSNTELQQVMRDKNMVFSSANSINIGRLLPQIIYYVYAYVQSWKNEQLKELDVVVPTGNFGNILAAFYAKNMGLPLRHLVSASNKNQILYDFLTTGEYDANRELHLTTSPSMDILISSNLERLLFELNDHNDELVNAWMVELKNNRKYTTKETYEKANATFKAGYASEEDVVSMVQSVYRDTNYLMDPHTAVAYHVFKELTDNETKTVIVSTASPYKFTRSVYEAIKGISHESDFALLEHLNEITQIPIPKAVFQIDAFPILHDTVIEKDEMQSVVEEILGL